MIIQKANQINSLTWTNGKDFILDCNDISCTPNSSTPRVEIKLPPNTKNFSCNILEHYGDNFTFFQILEISNKIYIPIIMIKFLKNEINIHFQDFNKTFKKIETINSNNIKVSIVPNKIIINSIQFNYTINNRFLMKYGIYSQDKGNFLKKISFSDISIG